MLVALLASSAASASAGGTPASPAGATGGVEYGVPVSKGRPVASTFRLSPTRLREGAAPKVVVRIDQPGVRSVAARVVLFPARGKGRIARADLGRVTTGRTLRLAWPKGAARPVVGTYRVRLHARDPDGATLRRSARASGRTALVVVARPRPKRKPKPAAPAPAAPTPPVVRNGGVFPVAGPHTYGDGLGADRGDHAHQGADLMGAEGTPIVAPLAGTVRHVDVQDGGAGHYVVMDAVDGRSFFFAHLKAGSVVVAEGAPVTMGQTLGQLGSTGASSAPHLHFEIWEGGWRVNKDSRFVDPMPQLRAWDAAAG